MVGGYKNTVAIQDLHMFNKVSHSWKVVGRIPSSRRDLAAAGVADNKIFVIGGRDDKGQYANTVWIGSCEPQ